MGSGTDNKMTYFLVVIVGLLAVVAIIVSAVALMNGQSMVTVYTGSGSAAGASGGEQCAAKQAAPKPVVVSQPVQGNYQPSTSSTGRIYLLALGHDYSSHEYFDESGYLKGFGIGMIDSVCSEADIDCRIVYDVYANCWDSKAGQYARGGQGLHGQWYDACVGWYTTVERTHVFQFALPYLKEPLANFYVLKGKTFDTSKASLMNAKIVFIEGWASDEKCMTRSTGVVRFPPDIAYAATATDAMRMLESGTYDAIFTTVGTLDTFISEDKVKPVGTSYSCMVAGNSIMSRKDSDVTMHWNSGFMKFKNSGRFRSYCTKANIEHAARGNLTCVDS